jgi:hypothetical protein
LVEHHPTHITNRDGGEHHRCEKENPEEASPSDFGLTDEESQPQADHIFKPYGYGHEKERVGRSVPEALVGEKPGPIAKPNQMDAQATNKGDLAEGQPEGEDEGEYRESQEKEDGGCKKYPPFPSSRKKA